MATRDNLNTQTSIVDFLKSQGKDSSIQARSQLAAEEGIVDDPSEFQGTAEQNAQLLDTLQTTGTEDPANRTTDTTTGQSVQTKEDAKTEINAHQGRTQEDGGVETRSSTQEINNLVDTVKSALVPSEVSTPQVPDLSQRLKTLRQSKGLNELEQEQAELKRKKRQLKADKRQRIQQEKDKRVATNVIKGRVSKATEQENRRINQVNRELQFVNDQIDTKTKAIKMTLQYEQTDFENAQSMYETRFDRNLSALKTATSLYQIQQDKQDRITENARANLQTIYNQLADGNVSYDSITDEQKALISKLETQSGLPTGFFKTLQSSESSGKVLSTTTRVSNGQKYADTVIRKPDGSFKTASFNLGTATPSDDRDLNESEKQRNAIGKVAPQLQRRAGENGYLSPEDWETARNSWLNSGWDVELFDRNFNQYINPDKSSQYSVSKPEFKF